MLVLVLVKGVLRGSTRKTYRRHMSKLGARLGNRRENKWQLCGAPYNPYFFLAL